MQLALLSYPTFVPGEFQLLHHFFEAGLELFHLRKPGWSETEVQAFIDQLTPSMRAKTVLHSQHHRAEAWGVKGLHFNQHSPYQHTPLQKSASLHGVEALHAAPGDLSYVFLSPVFNSISKQGYAAQFTDRKALASSLTAFKTTHTTRVFALGGVTSTHVNDVASWGFDGVAVLGAIWEPAVAGQQQQAIKQFHAIQEQCTHALIP